MQLGDSANRLGSLDGLTVAILGLSYRGGVKESAFSGAFATADALVRCRRVACRARPAVQR